MQRSPSLPEQSLNTLAIEFVRTHIDNLLCLTKGAFDNHLEKLERVLIRVQQAGLKVNAKKSFFAKAGLKCLGHWITRDGIQPSPEKAQAILRIETP